MKLLSCQLILTLFLLLLIEDSKSDRNCRRKGKCQSILLTKTYGSIQSPGYPRWYGNDEIKSWHIRVPKGYRIRLRFRKGFYVEDSAMCQKDALIVSLDKNFKDTKILCGSKRPRGVTSQRNELWLRFRSDDNGIGKGFLATYRAVDVNECKKEVCKFPSLCRNTVGSYMCDCPDGYVLRGRKNSGKCVDIDECKQPGVAQCGYKCVNTAGSYHCVCPLGYKLGYNEKTCRDVNECAEGNGGCSHQCLNTQGSFKCVCPLGFKLDESGKTCKKEIFFDNYQKINYVKEDADIGTVVARIKAKSSRKSGEKITYSIIAENLQAPTQNSAFKMDRHSGKIRVAKKLDREHTSEYLLEIEASYSNGSAVGGVTKARSFIPVRVLDVNDNAPRFTYTDYTIKVPCNVNPGSTLYRLVTFDDDEDENARVTYKLEPANRYFTIQRHSGKVKVLKTLRAFCDQSRDTMKNFEFKVIATDRGSPSLKSRVKVKFMIAGVDRTSQTMFVWYSKNTRGDFKVVQKKSTHKRGNKRRLQSGKRKPQK